MLSDYIFHNDKPVALMKIKEYNFDAILKHADYYIDHLDEIELDLLPDEFFEKFKEDIDWLYIIKNKKLTDDFIIKFSDKIDFDELSMIYKSSLSFLKRVKEKNIYYDPFNLIIKCNVDDDGIDFLEESILEEINEAVSKAEEMGISKLAISRMNDRNIFPYSVAISYILEEIDKNEMMYLFKKGVKDLSRNNFLDFSLIR